MGFPKTSQLKYIYIYIYIALCIGRRQYQCYLNILFLDVSVAQLVASMSGVVLGGVVEVVGSNLARVQLFSVYYITLYLSTVNLPQF